MFNIDNVKEMIDNNVFDDNFTDHEICKVVLYLNSIFELYNNTKTINGRLELYMSDFEEELFLVNSYKEISKIDISLYIYSEITVTLINGGKYLMSECSDYYFNAGVTLLKKGEL